MKFTYKNKAEFKNLNFLNLYLEGHKGFIAGGCFKDIFREEDVKDVDIFFESENDFKEALTFFEKHEDYEAVYSNDNAVSFDNVHTEVRVELIKTIYGTVTEVLRLFDFSICRFAFDGERAIYTENFFKELENRLLVIDGDIRFPVATFERSYRYKAYGFQLTRESSARLIDSLRTADTGELSGGSINATMY